MRHSKCGCSHAPAPTVGVSREFERRSREPANASRHASRLAGATPLEMRLRDHPTVSPSPGSLRLERSELREDGGIQRIPNDAIE